MVVVETERAYVRQWVLDDWVRFRVLAQDPRVMRWIGSGELWSDEKCRRFVEGGMERARERGWVLWPVIEKASWEMVGICGFNAAFEPEVEIGWWLRPAWWGRGLATEVAREVMGYGFRTWGFEKLISVARVENRASVRVMEKLGMGFEREFEHGGVRVVAYARGNPGERPGDGPAQRRG